MSIIGFAFEIHQDEGDTMKIVTCHLHDEPHFYAAGTECAQCKLDRLRMKECGQHAGVVRYSGDTCPMCRAIDLLIKALHELADESLRAEIGEFLL